MLESGVRRRCEMGVGGKRREGRVRTRTGTAMVTLIRVPACAQLHLGVVGPASSPMGGGAGAVLRMLFFFGCAFAVSTSSMSFRPMADDGEGGTPEKSALGTCTVRAASVPLLAMFGVPIWRESVVWA